MQWKILAKRNIIVIKVNKPFKGGNDDETVHDQREISYHHNKSSSLSFLCAVFGKFVFELSFSLLGSTINIQVLSCDSRECLSSNHHIHLIQTQQQQHNFY